MMACRDLQNVMDGTKQRRSNKMNYIKQSIWAFAAIALVACSSDDDKDTTESLSPVVNTSTSFTANIDAGNSASSKATRTTLVTDADVPYPVWAEGDQLHIYNATTPDNALFSLKSTEYVGQRQGVFDGTITKNAGDKFYALYCSTLTGNGAPTLTASNGSATISATIPSALVNYTAGFHPEYHFMTACTTENTFLFKNAMSLIKVNLSDNNYANFVIRKIHFKANNDENIAGAFTASVGNDGTIGTPSITSGASSEITISNSDGSALAAGVYYIPVLPSTLSGGFTLSFENTTDGAVYERSRTSSYTIGKSEIINLGSYTAKACAKEAYVDLGITNSSNQKVLWGIENIYDEAGETISGTSNKTVETDPTSSFYAWGETSVKSNQNKVADCQNYSWYYTYSFMEGTSDDGTSLQQRSYKYGVGEGSYTSSTAKTVRWGFPVSTTTSGQSSLTQDYSGVLRKYNSLDDYTSNISDWFGGVKDNKTTLDLEDDAAYQKSNGKMRIPSEDDFLALANASSNEASSKPLVCGPSAGSNGKLYKFKNITTGHYIELPINGYMRKTAADDADPHKQPTWGCYWTRNRSTSNNNLSYMARAAKIVVSGSTSEVGTTIIDANRCAGRMIRGVMYK